MVCLFLTNGKRQNKPNGLVQQNDNFSDASSCLSNISRKWWPTKTTQVDVYLEKIVKTSITSAKEKTHPQQPTYEV